MWQRTPVISELGRLRQEDCCKFETNLGYIARTGVARATWETLSLKINK